MDEQTLEASRVSTTFPDPPPFWKDFTLENLSQIELLQEESVAQGDNRTRLSLPTELINLQPPAEPVDGKWRVFGEQQSLEDELQSLEAAGIERLVPVSAELGGFGKDGKHTDRAFELKKMAKSLLLNFLELIGTMSINPRQGEDKVGDLRTLFINFHHVLNEYRPHQARESLIAMMQEQLDRKRAETAAIRGAVDKAKRVLEGLGSIEVPSAAPSSELPPPGPASSSDDMIPNLNEKANGAEYSETLGAPWKTESSLWEALDAEIG